MLLKNKQQVDSGECNKYVSFTEINRFDIYMHWFSCTSNGSASTFMCTKLHVHKIVTFDTNLYRLIYNLLFGIVFPKYFVI